MWNKAKAILLVTKERAADVRRYKTLHFNAKGRLNYLAGCVSETRVQHLYIINDDVIKVNNWYLATDKIEQCFSKEEANDLTSNCKKIIATTDNNLAIPYDGKTSISKDWDGRYLPQIPQSFIEQYITEYNKGKIISDVLVEYTELFGDKGILVDENNTINIKTVKDSFSREDMIKFAWWFINNTGQYSSDESAHLEGKYLDKYLQNL
jgi:hypothetical protein